MHLSLFSWMVEICRSFHGKCRRWLGRTILLFVVYGAIAGFFTVYRMVSDMRNSEWKQWSLCKICFTATSKWFAERGWSDRPFFPLSTGDWSASIFILFFLSCSLLPNSLISLFQQLSVSHWEVMQLSQQVQSSFIAIDSYTKLIFSILKVCASTFAILAYTVCHYTWLHLNGFPSIPQWKTDVASCFSYIRSGSALWTWLLVPASPLPGGPRVPPENTLWSQLVFQEKGDQIKVPYPLSLVACQNSCLPLSSLQNQCMIRIYSVLQVLTVTVRAIQNDHDQRKENFNSNPYFRLFINCLSEICSLKARRDNMNSEVFLSCHIQCSLALNRVCCWQSFTSCFKFHFLPQKWMFLL